MRYNRLTLAMLYIHFVPMALDMATMYLSFLAAGHTLAETNPILVMFGTGWLGVLITLGIIVLQYMAITKWSLGSQTFRWVVLSVVMLGLIARVIAIRSNILAIINPVSLVTAASSAAFMPEAKINYYMVFVLLLVLIPLAVQTVSFWLFRMEYKLEKRPGDR